MNGFIDIHTHLLPGVDDGAPNMTEALKLVRMAYQNGTRVIVLTPHYRGRFKKNSPAWIQETFSVFSKMVEKELPQMKLYLGNEVYYEQETPKLLADKRVLSINDTHYCLLEFGPGALKSQIITGVAETIRNGFVPIIAHVERYDICCRADGLIDEVLAQGALLQVNADSIMGKHGLKVKFFCHNLLKEQKVHFIATDAHDINKRPPLLRECFLRIHKRYGSEYAHQLFYDNALAIINGEAVW